MEVTYKFIPKNHGETLTVEIFIDAYSECDYEYEITGVYDTNDNDFDTAILDEEDMLLLNKEVEDFVASNSHEAYFNKSLLRAENMMDAWKDGD